MPAISQARAATRSARVESVSYTHLRAHETDSYLVCRLLLEKKKKTEKKKKKKAVKKKKKREHLVRSSTLHAY